MSYPDPWADDPYAPNEPPPPDPWEANPNAAPTDPGYAGAQFGQSESKENHMQQAPITVNSEGKFCATLKQHGGHDSPWLVLRADTAQEMLSLLSQVREYGVLDQVNVAASAFYSTRQGGAPNQTPPPAQQQPAQQYQQAPPQQQNYQQQAPAQPAGGQSFPWADGRHCQHGQMIPKEGVNKWNKPYRAYFCPTPKGTVGQCQAQFI